MFEKAATVVVGVALVPIGLFFLWHGVYRLRHPCWSASGWWSKHAIVTALLSGTLIPIPGMTRETSESFAAAVESGAGALVAVAGLLFIVSY
jgi:hypothetical protein